MHVLVKFSYLLASVLFILGLKLLSSPKTARRGNLYGALGMLIAIIVTLTDQKIIDFTYIIAGLLLGSALGVWMAAKVQMTAMPQMVGLLNGFGGGASTLVAYAEYLRMGDTVTSATLDVHITIVLGLLIGTVTFFGSIIAAAKLQGAMRSAPILYPLQTPPCCWRLWFWASSSCSIPLAAFCCRRLFSFPPCSASPASFRLAARTCRW
jgi:NAD(P) transhydrogenase subunit beta